MSDQCEGRKEGKEPCLVRDWGSSAVLSKSDLGKWHKQRLAIKGVFNFVGFVSAFGWKQSGAGQPQCAYRGKPNCKAADGYRSTTLFTKVSLNGRSDWCTSMDTMERKEVAVIQTTRPKCNHWCKAVEFEITDTNNECKTNFKRCFY